MESSEVKIAYFGKPFSNLKLSAHDSMGPVNTRIVYEPRELSPEKKEASFLHSLLPGKKFLFVYVVVFLSFVELIR
jgi:hypothetical protein